MKLPTPFALCIALLAFPLTGQAQKAYDPGASDTEIRLGQTAPFSGPASLYGTVAKANAAFFERLNASGGINGRKVVLLTEDDSFSPPKTMEQTRKLVERDQVLLVYNTLGTATNTAVQRYLNTAKVPQFLISSGASKWNNPAQYPWTTPMYPNNRTEARIYAKHMLASKRSTKVGILYQNDDFGKDYVEGLTQGFGAAAATMLVAKASYELTDPTIDSQVLALKEAGVDTVMLAAFGKQAAQAMRKIGSLGWKPAIYLSWVSSSVPSVMAPTGPDNSTGVISSAAVKDPADARWQNDPDMIAYKDLFKKYYPQGDVNDLANVWPYATSSLFVRVLQKAGDNLTRENIQKQLLALGEQKLPMMLPGITYHITPTDYDAIKAIQLQRFDGKQWVPVGDPTGP